jgi:hypothetical protein
MKHRSHLLLCSLLAGVFLVTTGPVPAAVNGTWPTTALTRIVVTQPLFPRASPDSTVEIADGSYQFGDDGTFSAGSVLGTWTQNRAGAYSIRVNAANRASLVDEFRQSMIDQGLDVTSVGLLKISLTGRELVQRIDETTDHNTLWGDEAYIYRVVLNNNGVRQILRVAMTLRVASDPPPPQAASAQAAIAAVQPEPKPTALELAAVAVARYARNLEVRLP